MLLFVVLVFSEAEGGCSSLFVSQVFLVRLFEAVANMFFEAVAKDIAVSSFDSALSM